LFAHAEPRSSAGIAHQRRARAPRIANHRFAHQRRSHFVQTLCCDCT
jgi:hypothetical protein